MQSSTKEYLGLFFHIYYKQHCNRCFSKWSLCLYGRVFLDLVLQEYEVYTNTNLFDIKKLLSKKL